jgi:amidophosphoribosyltransferase
VKVPYLASGPVSLSEHPVGSASTADLTERPDKPEEACGVFAVLAPGQQVANLTYFGLYALQHRGQESAGIAVFNGEKVR